MKQSDPSSSPVWQRCSLQSRQYQVVSFLLPDFRHLSHRTAFFRFSVWYLVGKCWDVRLDGIRVGIRPGRFRELYVPISSLESFSL